MKSESLSNYQSRAVRALVLLHEKEMRDFLPVWREARAANLKLPQTDDPDYLSLHALLHHVFRAGRGYVTWICEKLSLPDPGIKEAPDADAVEKAADEFLSHLLDRWRITFAIIENASLDQVHTSRWGVQMSIESMLEHAVVHPMRHRFQLQELMRP